MRQGLRQMHQTETTSWVQEQNERNRRHDQRPARRHQEGQKRRHRRADPPGGGGGGDDPGWSDWSDSQDDHHDNQEDARSYSTYSDTTRRGSARSGGSTISGAGGRRRPARNQGKPNLPMYGSSKDEMTYPTWRCYVLGLRKSWTFGPINPNSHTEFSSWPRGRALCHVSCKTMGSSPR